MMLPSQPFYLFLFLSNLLAVTGEAVEAVLAFMDSGAALLVLVDSVLQAAQFQLPILAP
jgi:hypothetical protein